MEINVLPKIIISCLHFRSAFTNGYCREKDRDVGDENLRIILNIVTLHLSSCAVALQKNTN